MRELVSPFMYSTEEMHYPVCLFNHNFHTMIKKIPWDPEIHITRNFLTEDECLELIVTYRKNCTILR